MKLVSPKQKIDNDLFERINFINEHEWIEIDTDKVYALSELKSDIVVFCPKDSKSFRIKFMCDMPGMKYTLVAFTPLDEYMHVSFVSDNKQQPIFIFSENGEIIEEVQPYTVVIYELYQVGSYVIAVRQSVLELNEYYDKED